jgi:hypothetical protein
MAITHCIGADIGAGDPHWTATPTSGPGAVDRILICTIATNVLSWIAPASFNSGGPVTQACLGIDSTTDVISWSTTLP